MGVHSPAICGFDSPARESGRLEGTAVGLCYSGPIDPSPIDICRVGVFLEGSVPIALFSDPELLVIFSTTMQGRAGSKSSMYTGTNPSCKDVPGRMGDKAFAEWGSFWRAQCLLHCSHTLLRASIRGLYDGAALSLIHGCALSSHLWV